MSDEDITSPEEKLLKVIRSGGRSEQPQEHAPVPGPVAAKAPERAALKLQPPVVPKVAADESRPPAVEASAPIPNDRSVDRDPVPAPGSDVPAGVSPVRVPFGLYRWIGLLTRALAAGAVLLLIFAAWDVWAYFSNWGDRMPSIPAESAAAGMVVHLPTEHPPKETALARFRDRPLFALSDAVPRPPDDGPQPVRADWERYVRSNLKLLGLSVLDAEAGVVEAILSDDQTGTLLYLKKGDHFVVEGTRLAVETVTRDEMVLTDGARRVDLK